MTTRAPVTILEALADPCLLGATLQRPETFHAWRVCLAAMFGLPIADTDMALFTACTGRTVAPTDRATEAYVIAGRRSRKTLVLSAIAAYVAAFVDWSAVLGPGERGVVHLIAADRKQARIAFRYTRAFLQGSPMLARLIERETADSLDLTNQTSIEISTASYRTTRGYSVIATLLDEAAFFSNDDSSAEPDREIVNALLPGMATTGGMLLVASSPYRKRGILFEARRRHWGVNDSSVLVWQSDSRTMNPTISREIVDAAIERDASAAASEWLGEFRSDLEDFVSRETILSCIVQGQREIPPAPDVRYYAFADPSGGSGQDSFTMCIAHRDGDRVVIDALRERRPPLSPESVVADFANLLERYGVRAVTADRYAAQWAVEAWSRHGVTVEHSELTASALFAELLPVLNSREITLLDHERMISQLCSLERRTGRAGRDSISHPPGHHDDVAVAVAGAAFIAGAAAQKGEFSIGFTGYGGSGPITWIPRERGRISALSGECGQHECVPGPGLSPFIGE
jgi:hypothetical protein